MAVEVLMQQGWNLSPAGIEKCTEDGVPSNKVIQIALNSDLRDIGAKVLPDDINKGKVDFVEGPCILQIQKIRNVSTPKDSEENHGVPRLLRLTLTDGHTGCNAIEIESLDNISLMTMPGTKIKLLSTVMIEHNFLLLNNKNSRWLGGRVDKLAESWELKRSLSNPQRKRATGHEGPPPFVPFGQAHKVEKITNDKKDTFKSLGKDEPKKLAAIGEFEQQRQATIAVVLQTKGDGAAKVFGGGKNQFSQDRNLAKIVDMGFSPEDALSSLKICNNNLEEAVNSLINRAAFPLPGNKAQIEAATAAKPPPRRRGAWDRDTSPDDGAIKNRPSTTATLFDFLDKSTKEDVSQAVAAEPDPTPPSSPPQQPTPPPSNLPPPPAIRDKQDTESSPHDYNHVGTNRRYESSSYQRKQNLPPRLANRYQNLNNTQSRLPESTRRNVNRNYNNNSNSDRAKLDMGYRPGARDGARGSYGNTNPSFNDRGKRNYKDGYSSRGYSNTQYDHYGDNSYSNHRYNRSLHESNTTYRGTTAFNEGGDYRSYRDDGGCGNWNSDSHSNWNGVSEGMRDWNNSRNYRVNQTGRRDYNSRGYNTRDFTNRDYNNVEYNTRAYNNHDFRQSNTTSQQTRSVKFSNNIVTNKINHQSPVKGTNCASPDHQYLNNTHAVGGSHGNFGGGSSDNYQQVGDNYQQVGDNYQQVGDNYQQVGDNYQQVGDMQINLDENEMLYAPAMPTNVESSFNNDEWPQNGADSVQYYYPRPTVDGLDARIYAAGVVQPPIVNNSNSNNCEMIYNDPAVVMATHQHPNMNVSVAAAATAPPPYYGVLSAPATHNDTMSYHTTTHPTQPLSINSNFTSPSYPVFPGEDWLLDMNDYSHAHYPSPSTDSTVDSEPHTQELKRLDKCMARYSGDGAYYEAVIEAISPNMPVCLVTFSEYGNSEEVSISDIRPVPKAPQGGDPLQPNAQPFVPEHVTVATTTLPYAPPVPLEQSPFPPYQSSEHRRNKKSSSSFNNRHSQDKK